MLIGVISDTHGVLAPSALATLGGVDHIIHAGDIGGASILAELELIAPVTGVAGNTDGGECGRLPHRQRITIDGVQFLIGHNLASLFREGIPDDIDVVVSGHTHEADVSITKGTLFVNPGSASYPRREMSPSVAVIETTGGRPDVRICAL